MQVRKMTISVIIPTYRAASHLPSLITALRTQTLPADEIIAIDTTSSDGTAEIAKRENLTVMSVLPQDFRHGRARNQAVRASSGEIVVLLTQDALPTNPEFLEKLTEPLRNGLSAAAYARQIAYPNANPLEQYARAFNYPERSFLRKLEDVDRLGIKAFFFSNTASAVTRKAFDQVGGFSESVIVNEDMLLCSRLLHLGHSVAYVAEAAVYHSHQYNYQKLFGRYFDIGAFFYQAENMLRGGRTQGEGFAFVRQAARKLIQNRQYRWLVRLAGESIVKIIAFQMGKHHRRLPLNLKLKLSAHPSYWTQ